MLIGKWLRIRLCCFWLCRFSNADWNGCVPFRASSGSWAEASAEEFCGQAPILLQLWLQFHPHCCWLHVH